MLRGVHTTHLLVVSEKSEFHVNISKNHVPVTIRLHEFEHNMHFAIELDQTTSIFGKSECECILCNRHTTRLVFDVQA